MKIENEMPLLPATKVAGFFEHFFRNLPLIHQLKLMVFGRFQNNIFPKEGRGYREIRSFSRKGFVESVAWTALVAIAVLFVFMIALLLYISSKLPIGFLGDNTASAEFIAGVTQPYAIATVLSSYMAGDRNMLEHAAEIGVSGSKEKAGSDFPAYFRHLANLYTEDFVSAEIRKEDGARVLYVDNLESKCGNSLEGFCVDSTVYFKDARIDQGCGNGRKKIEASSYTSNKCSTGVCCVEDTGASNVQRCGPVVGSVKQGICDHPRFGTDECLPGRVRVQSDECSAGICCIAATNVKALEKSGLAGVAEIPLLYRSSFAILQIAVGQG